MEKLFRKSTVLLLLVALLGAWSATRPIMAQGGSAVFRPYQCQVDQGTGRADVRAVLVDERGRPYAQEQIDVSVSGPDGALDSDGGRVLAERSPLHLIIVMDITTTMPLRQLETALIDGLIPELSTGDQVALITFSEEISPRTAFYTDKGALANDHIRDMLPLQGNNRLFSAIAEAVDGFPADARGRKAVLVLTDSTPRTGETTTVTDIVTLAERANVQVYPLAIVTNDRPAIEELESIAASTEGRAWTHTMQLNPSVPFEEAVMAILSEFVQSLGGEILVETNLPDVPLDAAGSFELELAATLLGEGTVSDTVTCSYPRLNHEIRFVDAETDTVVTEPTTIQVAVESDLPEDVLSVRFLDRDEEVDILPVGDDGTAVLTFDVTQVPAGRHVISAELLNRAGSQLAQTEQVLNLDTQGTLQLRFVPGGGGDGIASAARFVVESESFDQIQFTVAPAASPESAQLYGELMAVDDERRVSLELASLQDGVAMMFPDREPEERFLLGAVVPDVDGRQALAVAEPVTIPLPSEPVETVIGEEVAPPVAVPTVGGPLIPAVASLFLLAMNFVLYRQIRWTQIRQMIQKADRSPMSPQLMSVTVHRNGLKQSHTLTKRTVTVGRGANNDINLGGDTSISRQHAVFMWRRGKWYFSFRKRGASARVNGKMFRRPVLHQLKPVCEIDIGGTRLIFHSNAQQDVSDYIKTDF